MKTAVSIMVFNPRNATLFVSAGRPEQFPAKSPPQIAFSGRSNVGRAAYQHPAGAAGAGAGQLETRETITINFYNVDNKLCFVDLRATDMPGVRLPKAALVAPYRRYFTNNPSIGLLSLVLQLVDLNTGPSADDILMLDFLGRSGIKHIIVASKADKLSKTRRDAAIAALGKHPVVAPGVLVVPFSSKSGEGKSALLSEIWKAAQPQRK